MFQLHAGNQQHDSADGGEQNCLAAVGFDKNQTENQADKNSRKKNSAFERVHLPLRQIAIPREHDDERDFGEFGRLEGKVTATNPTMRAMAGMTNEGREHQNEQNQCEAENQPHEFL